MFIKSSRRPNRAPVIFTNQHGHLPWGGRYAYQLSELEVHFLMGFVHDEARRMGWNDAHYRRESMENPFHPEFLSGSPYFEWNRALFEGREAYWRTQTEGAVHLG